MKKITYTITEAFYAHYNIEPSFIQQLQEYEIIRVEMEDKDLIIAENELVKLEKMVRLYHDLEINPQGLQAIYHLLEKVNALQDELLSMRRKLDRFV